MEKFMKEEIFYVSDDYAEKLVYQYTGQKREKMIEDLKGTLRILKFYTNNDFPFKDVHNEELFYQMLFCTLNDASFFTLKSAVSA